MKRKNFTKVCLAVSSFVWSPIAFLTSAARSVRASKGFKVDSGKDRFDKAISPIEGDTFFTKISTKDTDGDMYVFESTRLKEGGPAHHIHFDQDEWWYVLQGQFLIKIGDTTYEAKAGDSIFGPRMIPHSFSKVGEGVAKLLIIFQPAGKMEELFKKLSEGVDKNMSEEEQNKFREQHGVKIVGPRIRPLK